MSLVRTVMERRELLRNLVTRELKIRYRGSALGFFWSVLIPLFMALIYVFFLRLLGGRGVPLADIIIGVFAWQYTVQCVNSGLSAITGNTNLVKKVYFPRIILPLSVTVANLITYLLSLVVQFPIVAILFHIYGQSMSPFWYVFPVVIVFQTLFNLSLTLLLCSANVYYRDAQHLVGILLSALFFVSPVMYNLGFVENVADRFPWAVDLYLLNPVAVIITAYRWTIDAAAASPWTLAALGSIACCLLLLVLSYRVFERLQKDFADML